MLRPSVSRPPFRPSIPSSIHPSVRPSIHPNFRTYIHPFVRSFIRSLVHSFIRSFVHSFIHSFIHSSAFLSSPPLRHHHLCSQLNPSNEDLKIISSISSHVIQNKKKKKKKGGKGSSASFLDLHLVEILSNFMMKWIWKKN